MTSKLSLNLEAIGHNLKKIRDKVGVDIAAVIKADGYGLGALRLATYIEDNRLAAMLCVGDIEEGVYLRKNGIISPILVLGSPERLEDFLEYNIIPNVFEWEIAKKLNRLAAIKKKTIDIHIAVDTGMTRLGKDIEHTSKLLKKIEKCPNLKVDGIFSHFAEAEAEDTTFTDGQIEKMEWLKTALEKSGWNIKYYHMANSAAALNMVGLFGLARIGLAMFGVSMCKDSYELKAAIRWETRIVCQKTVPKGRYVSYNKEFLTYRKTKIAIIPIGYADGLDRRLSNVGYVLINGQRAAIIGKICMNQTILDVTDIESCRNNIVTIIGTDGGKSISIEDIAKLCHTCPHEIVTTLRLARGVRTTKEELNLAQKSFTFDK